MINSSFTCFLGHFMLPLSPRIYWNVHFRLEFSNGILSYFNNDCDIIRWKSGIVRVIETITSLSCIFNFVLLTLIEFWLTSRAKKTVIWPILAVHGVILSSDLGLSREISSPAASSMPCRTNSTSLLIFAVIIVHINFNATPTNAHKNKIYGYWLKCFRLDEAYLGSKTTSGPDFRSRLNSRLWNPRIGDWAYLWAKS